MSRIGGGAGMVGGGGTGENFVDGLAVGGIGPRVGGGGVGGVNTTITRMPTSLVPLSQIEGGGPSFGGDGQGAGGSSIGGPLPKRIPQDPPAPPDRVVQAGGVDDVVT